MDHFLTLYQLFGYFLNFLCTFLYFLSFSTLAHIFSFICTLSHAFWPLSLTFTTFGTLLKFILYFLNFLHAVYNTFSLLNKPLFSDQAFQNNRVFIQSFYQLVIFILTKFIDVSLYLRLTSSEIVELKQSRVAVALGSAPMAGQRSGCLISCIYHSILIPIAKKLSPFKKKKLKIFYVAK